MPLSLERFIESVVETGLLPAEEIRALAEAGAADHRPQDGEQLARELVRRKRLTAYQATAIYQGKGQGLILGNYVVLEKLGQGGMGMVLKAEHRRMKRIVALKVLSPAVTKSPDVAKRFQREVEAAARLEHPNIVTAYDADQSNGVHFLVMQFVDGSDLSVIVKQQGPLPVDKAVHCLLQAARGLQYAHAQGVIHRDIKPANLLLDRSGTVKILDMGLARIEHAAGQAELTQTGAVMGTVDYMSPEQALNTKYADQRADIYSLGISLYYLLTGKAAYDGESLMEKLLAHRDRPIPVLAQACPGVTPRLEAVFQKMVAKKPEDRYQSMSDVIADLEVCLTPGASAPTAAPGADNDQFSNFLRGLDGAGPSLAVKAVKSGSTEGGAAETRARPAGKRNGPEVLDSHKPSPPAWWKQRPAIVAAAMLPVVLLAAVFVFSGRGSRTAPPDERTAKRPAPKLANSDSAKAKRAKPDNARSDIKGSTAVGARSQKESQDGEGWTSLFDGQNLNGWEAVGSSGTWVVRNGVLIATGNSVGWLSSSQEYADFELELEYRLPKSGNSGVFFRATRDGAINGGQFLEIQLLDDEAPEFRLGLGPDRKTGALFGLAAPLQPAQAPSGSWHSMRIEVLGRRVRETLNGTLLLDVDLDAYRQQSKRVPGLHRKSGYVGLQAHGSFVEFRNIRIRELDSSQPQLRGELDLLKLVDPKRDTVAGRWGLKGNTLVVNADSDEKNWARLIIPYKPVPREYDLTISLTRRWEDGYGFNVGFINGPSQGMLVIDGYPQPRIWGLERIDGKNPQANGTAVSKPLSGTRRKILLQVRRNGVNVFCDGRELIRWKGEPRQLSIWGNWQVPDRQVLFLGAQSAFNIDQLTLTPIAGEDQPP